MSLRPLISVCLLLAAANGFAEQPTSCRTTIAAALEDESRLSSSATVPPGTIQLLVGRIQAQLGELPTATMSNGVLLRSDDKLAGADAAHYDPTAKALHLEGNVRYEDTGTQILSDSAEFAYVNGRVRFEGAEFSLGSNNARGGAEALEINDDGELILDGVEYTTCPPGSEDWLIRGESIKLDTSNGIGTAKGMKLRFKGIPILYAPYLSFPIGDARKSGILTPEIGSAGRSGNEIRVPYYINIAPNYDATITPRLLTSRGLQLETQFRYLTPRNEGELVADYLPSDDILNRTRHQVRFSHRTLFGNGWRNQIDLREVSDSQYFEDLGGSLSVSSITHLNRYVRFDYHAENLSLLAQAQDFQTIDDTLLADQEPYRRLPQILINAGWDMPLGFRFGIDSELVNFDRDVGVTGWRFNAVPGLERPISAPGWYIKPSIELDYTRYELSNTLPGATASPDRVLPISSLDAGMILERSMADPNRIQTLEPRILYAHIPFENQDDIPVFDTIEPDINLVQLFRRNRFLGVDRIGETDQLSVGVTSRVLDVASGRELMSATIGQTRYFSDREVLLPGGSPVLNTSSDYIAQLRFLLREDLNFDVGHQWGSGASDTTKSEARLQYRPAQNKILNLAYRFRRDSLEQGDLSWSWPVAARWNFVGRYNYSFRDDEVLEQFFGLEYESCCWGLTPGLPTPHLDTRRNSRFLLRSAIGTERNDERRDGS